MENQTQAKVCNNCQDILTEKGQMTEVTPHYQEISDGWEQKDPPSIRKSGGKAKFYWHAHAQPFTDCNAFTV